MDRQRYVSRELTHFVGRDQPEDEQYNLLIQILKDGWLLADPQNRNEVYPFPTDDTFVLNIDESQGSIAEDVSQPVFKPLVVCFCDIPIDDLGIHMSKYSRFGLSFLKPFLISKGANPVFYIARHSKAMDTILDTREPYFQQEFERYRRLFPVREDVYNLLKANMDDDTFQRYYGDLLALYKFLAYHVFGFIKVFDDAVAEDNPNNFYMEREWRVLGNMRFEVSDVYRVILPESYAGRLREDLPDYQGQITFAS
jgi:hypothetical protein